MKSLKIGVTGGIGSGKTTVCQILEAMGYPVFYSDKVARQIQETDTGIIAQIKELLGENIYEDGKLKRSEVARLVFSNSALLQQLNRLIHPAVRKEFEHFCSVQTSPFIFNEAAILLQTEAHKNLDIILLVIAPIELRVKRVMLRDSVSEKDVLQRLKHQTQQDELMRLTPFHIVNDEKQLLLPQLLELIEQWKKHA